MTILFCDFNGTIVNDTLIWDEARRQTFLAFGQNPPTIAEHFQAMNSGDYLDVYRERGIKAARPELNAIYERTYEAEIHSVDLFPQVKETLLQLKESRISLILVTTQMESLVSPLLDKFEINTLFENRLFHVLNKKVVIREIIEKRDIDPKQCYFVGDSPSDVRRAKEAGVTAIAFLTGYIPDNLLIAMKADHYIRSFKEIIEIVPSS